MISLRSTSFQNARTAASITRRGPAARRTLASLPPPVRAGAGSGNSGGSGPIGDALQSVGDAVVRLFSAPKDDAPNQNWAHTSTDFTGRINHRNRGHARPFKDGFASGAKAEPTSTPLHRQQPPPTAGGADATAPAAAEAPSQKDGATGDEPLAAGRSAFEASVDYVGGALESMLGKKFSSREDSEQPSTGAAGWKGDVRSRKQDGFHTRRH